MTLSDASNSTSASVFQTGRHIEFAQQRADRDQLVLHRWLLFAGVVEIGRVAHRPDRRIPLAFREHGPCCRCFFLNAGLSGPVVVLGGSQIGFDLVEMGDLRTDGRGIA
jgi:hypothetical protein